MRRPSRPERSASPRSRARHAGEKFFEADCPDHGRTSHHVKNGRCARCFTSAGERRVRVNGYEISARAHARNRGESFYVADCDVHERSYFHVRVGKCSLCFTANGARRKQVGNAARREARSRGEATFPDTCGTHGETAHSVAHGKCLKCFTTAGTARKHTHSPIDCPYDLPMAMLRQGWGPADLAAHLGVTEQQVVNWMRQDFYTYYLVYQFERHMGPSPRLTRQLT